jgi:hypothetical protein
MITKSVFTKEVYFGKCAPPAYKMSFPVVWLDANDNMLKLWWKEAWMPVIESGIRMVNGSTVDHTTIKITWNQGVELVPGATAPYGMKVFIDGVPATVSGLTLLDPKTMQMKVSPRIEPGEKITWSYAATGPLKVVTDKTAVTAQKVQSIDNTLTVADPVIRMETGTVDIVIVEEDPTKTQGVETEEAI